MKIANAICKAHPGVRGADQNITMAVNAVQNQGLIVDAKTARITHGDQKITSAMTNAQSISLLMMVLRNHAHNFLIFSLNFVINAPSSVFFILEGKC